MAKQPVDPAALYAAIMEEIKIRFDAINAGTMNRLVGLPGQVVKEFCYLQIRLICELVALACLVAHGDIKQSNKLTKQWAADKIFDELTRLHPDFFPKAVRVSKDEFGPLVAPVNGRLTKDGLVALYHECGSILHRGNVRKLLKQNLTVQVHYPEITAKAQKLVDLLQEHMVSMTGNRKNYICILRNPASNFRVAVITVEKPSPSEEAELYEKHPHLKPPYRPT